MILVLVVGLERAGFTVWEYAVRRGPGMLCLAGAGIFRAPRGSRKECLEFFLVWFSERWWVEVFAMDSGSSFSVVDSGGPTMLPLNI